MAKRTRAPKVEVSAKAHAIAKATFERKKVIKENVPEDVSRAKAGAWLTLISPFTEWAGLKGDALRFKRQQLRIQQEDSLFRLAQTVRRKLAGTEHISAVPNKIVVPALEKASLEDPSDTLMIEMWANLLASACTGREVEPRYVGIIAELSGSQARALSTLVRNRADDTEAPYSAFKYGHWELTDSMLKLDIEQTIEKSIQSKGVPDLGQIESELREWARSFDCPGIYLEHFSFNNLEFRMMIGEGLDIAEKDIQILESLGIVRRSSFEYDYEIGGATYTAYGACTYLSGMGIDFVTVCEPDLIKEYEDREDRYTAARDAKLEA